jgi:hypothetical protein
VPGPFRASGPIFVREAADRAAAPGPGEVPEQIRSRLLSVRAYDAQGMMLDADVTEGAGLEGAIERFFGHEAIGYLHVHFARRGCYGCRVDRC